MAGVWIPWWSRHIITPPTHITTQRTHPPPTTTDLTSDHDDAADDDSVDLLANSQSSANPSPHKRRHTKVHEPTTYIRFTVPIDSNTNTITTTLLGLLNGLPEPLGHCINHHPSTESPPHPQMLSQKVIVFEIIQPSPTRVQHIIDTVSSTWAHSFPSCSPTNPTTPLPSGSGEDLGDCSLGYQEIGDGGYNLFHANRIWSRSPRRGSALAIAIAIAIPIPIAIAIPIPIPIPIPIAIPIAIPIPIAIHIPIP